MLQLIDISKSYGGKTILDGISFVVNAGERIGLVGPNGCGKTTLLRIITGEEHPDSGSVAIKHGETISYLLQSPAFASDQTVIETLRSGIPGYIEARRHIEALESAMAAAADLDAVLAQYDTATIQFEALGGYSVDHRAETLCAHLGLGDVGGDTPVALLSGGQQTRLGLARLLLSEPSILLLDEPTNHLDLAALEWLESFVAAYRGAVLIVSHDRVFLDRTVSGIVEIDELTHQAGIYTGSYTDYAQAKRRGREKQQAAWTDQQEDIRRAEAAIRRISGRADRYQNQSQNDFQRRKARVLMRKATAQKTRLQRYIDAEERVEKPRLTWSLKVDFGEMPRGGQEVIRLENAGHSYDGERTLFKGADLLLLHGERIVLLGPNGCGKSTLMQAVVGQLTLSAGAVHIGTNVRIGYMPQKQESLDPAIAPFGLIQSVMPVGETEVRNFLHYFLFAGDDVFIPVGNLSSGQRSRLLLAKLIAQGANCLVLDEPLNHLDIPSRENFEAALDAFPGTILITTHDRAFIDRFATGIWAYQDGTIRRNTDRREMV
jgi:ATP-binding cassette subfamily F protein 3